MKKNKCSIGPGLHPLTLGKNMPLNQIRNHYLQAMFLYLSTNSSNLSVANVQKELQHKYRIRTQTYAATRVVTTFEQMKNLTIDEQFSLLKRFCEGSFEVPMSKQRGIEKKCGKE